MQTPHLPKLQYLGPKNFVGGPWTLRRTSIRLHPLESESNKIDIFNLLNIKQVKKIVYIFLKEVRQNTALGDSIKSALGKLGNWQIRHSAGPDLYWWGPMCTFLVEAPSSSDQLLRKYVRERSRLVGGPTLGLGPGPEPGPGPRTQALGPGPWTLAPG